MNIKLETLWSDRLFRRLLVNASWLMSGNAIAAGFGLIAMVTTARSLGPADFGVLVLMTSYVGSVDRLVNFQTWQAFIKYGSEALEHKNTLKLQRLTSVCTLIDVATAFMGAIVAALGASVIADWLDLGVDQRHWLVLYAGVIIFNLVGVPTGVLRLFNRFHTLAGHQVLMKAVNLLGVALVLLVDGGLPGFLLSIAVSQVIANLSLLVFSWMTLSANGVRRVSWNTVGTAARMFPGLWRFVFFTNIESSIKILRELDVFVIKAFLSNDSVGIYRVARRFAEVLHMIIDPFFHSIYPEFTKLRAVRDKSRYIQLIRRASLMIGLPILILWVLFLLFGHKVIIQVFGIDYADAYLPAVLCTLGAVTWAFSSSLPGANVALGHVRDNFWIHLFAAVAYIAALPLLCGEYEILGAGIGYLMFSVVWGVMIFSSVVYRVTTWQVQEET